MASSGSLYEHATACEAAFSRITLDQTAPSYVVAETLRQRFEQWSSNMGVFAVPQFSLDARLAHSDSLRNMVLDLLELMKTGLDRGMPTLVSCVCLVRFLLTSVLGKSLRSGWTMKPARHRSPSSSRCALRRHRVRCSGGCFLVKSRVQTARK